VSSFGIADAGMYRTRSTAVLWRARDSEINGEPVSEIRVDSIADAAAVLVRAFVSPRS